MRTTESEAFEAMLAHHGELTRGVTRRVAAVSSTVERDGGCAPAVAELVAYLAEEVLPHAVAEEHTVYPMAAEREELTETVAEMVDEHRRLAASLERLATTANAPDAAAEAEAIGSLFAAHVAKENELVLPPLAADETVELADLLVQMHRLTEAAQEGTSTAEDAHTPDSESRILDLVLVTAGQLAEVEQGDRACRLAATAWAVLRVPRPDLAVRVTAALHRLVRSVATEPVRFATRRPATHDDPASLDVRTLAPAQRHETIFAAYGALAPGGAFVLVNDHDPKPLRYQFAAEHPGEFTWDLLEAGPVVWRVRIGRPAGADPEADRIGGIAGPTAGEPELDIRRLPHGQRHETIFTTYEALAEGHGFVLVNDHDPKPLHYQFEAQHPGHFTWDYLEQGPRTWRVHIGRRAVEEA